MFPNDEFDLSNFYFLSEVNENDKEPAEESTVFNESFSLDTMPQNVIKISDATGDTTPVVYTYAKFFEILDTKGLSGLVNAQ